MLTKTMILFCADKCIWNVENGWYRGTVIKYIAADNKGECSKACCDHPYCGTWTWTDIDNNCILKKGDDSILMTEGGYWTAIKNESKLIGS